MSDIPPPSRDVVFLGLNLVHLASGTPGGMVRGLVNPSYTWTTRISSAIVGGLTTPSRRQPSPVQPLQILQEISHWFDGVRDRLLHPSGGNRRPLQIPIDEITLPRP